MRQRGGAGTSEGGPRPTPAGDGTGTAGLRVLAAAGRLHEDGASRTNLSLVQRWQERGVTVRVVVVEHMPRSRRGAPLPAGVVPIHPTPPGTRTRWALAGALRELLRLAPGADVVVAGREIQWGLVLGRVASLLSRRPFAVMIHSDPGAAIEQYIGPRLRPLMRWSLRTADRLICVSPGLVPAVEALGVAPRRVSVVLNGIDVAAVEAAATATATPDLPRGEGPLVLALGRLNRQKGFDLLIRAHAQVLAAGVPHRLLILGEGSEREALERLVAELDVAQTVTMPGFAEQPAPAVAAADLYVLPSRWEGFGLTLAEAMVLGTPVVAADCVSGPRQLLADGLFGDLVPVADVDALATAMERHLREPDRLVAAAIAGQRWAREHLDVGRTADEVLDVLRDLVRR